MIQEKRLTRKETKGKMHMHKRRNYQVLRRSMECSQKEVIYGSSCHLSQTPNFQRLTTPVLLKEPRKKAFIKGAQEKGIHRKEG
jgi:hypothetical protein